MYKIVKRNTEYIFVDTDGTEHPCSTLIEKSKGGLEHIILPDGNSSNRKYYATTKFNKVCKMDDNNDKYVTFTAKSLVPKNKGASLVGKTVPKYLNKEQLDELYYIVNTCNDRLKQIKSITDVMTNYEFSRYTFLLSVAEKNRRGVKNGNDKD